MTPLGKKTLALLRAEGSLTVTQIARLVPIRTVSGTWKVLRALKREDRVIFARGRWRARDRPRWVRKVKWPKRPWAKYPSRKIAYYAKQQKETG